MVVAAAVVVAALVTSGCSKDDPKPTALVIGDSLTVGAEIGGLGDDGTVTVDAREDRTTEAGTAVAKAADVGAYEQVIVALGTNDYTDTAEEFLPKIGRMMDALGPDTKVTWVNVDAGTTKLQPAAAGVNAALEAAADRYPNLTIADWNVYIAGRGDGADLRAADGVHDTPEGYRVRAAWMQGLVDA